MNIRRAIPVLIIGIILPLSIALGLNNKAPQFKLASSEKMREFNKHQYIKSINHMPPNIQSKHKETIERIDHMIENGAEPTAITSYAENFDLGYYSKIIGIGILPYLEEGLFRKDVESLLFDISALTLDLNPWGKTKHQDLPAI